MFRLETNCIGPFFVTPREELPIQIDRVDAQKRLLLPVPRPAWGSVDVPTIANYRSMSVSTDKERDFSA